MFEVMYCFGCGEFNNNWSWSRPRVAAVPLASLDEGKGVEYFKDL